MLIFKPKIPLSFSAMLLALLSLVSGGCRNITVSSGTSASISSDLRFATGTKAVKIITSDSLLSGSFSSPTAAPTPMIIPNTLPGGNGVDTYLPGISAATYFDIDGTTSITRPDWLLDFQVGITGAASSSCATFGNGTALDPLDFYHVSERNCGGVANGVGGGSDPVFFRIVLDRDTTKIGTAENLLIHVEYQASGLRLNSDGTNFQAEDNLDQLWKIHWNSTLATLIQDPPRPFGIFVPPNYSACLNSGSGTTGAPGACADPDYRGSPIKVRQFVVPISAFPTLKVIQFTRMKGRISATGGTVYVGSFCSGTDPLCLGVVIRSVTIMRI